jgi:hypothetical protein
MTGSSKTFQYLAAVCLQSGLVLDQLDYWGAEIHLKGIQEQRCGAYYR